MKQVLSREWKREGIMNKQSGESKEEEVMDEGTGESKTEKLVPEWGWRTDKGSWFQRQGEAEQKGANQLFLERMMSVAKQQQWRMKSEYC